MSKNLLSYIQDAISNEAISKIGSLLGENQGNTKSAISAALPTLLKGIINRGDTAENVTALNKFIGDNNINANMLDNMGSDSYSSMGSKAVDFLFGTAKSTLLGNIGKAAGFNSSKTSSLVGALAPMALHYVSKLGKSNNYTDTQMASYLDSQKANLSNARTTASTTTRGTSSTATTSSHTTEAPKGGGGGLLKWLIPLLLIGGLIWWWTTRNAGSTVATGDKTEMTSESANDSKATATHDHGHDHSHDGHNHDGHNHDGHNHDGHDHSDHSTSSSTTTSSTETSTTTEVSSSTDGMQLTMDEMGNLVDKDGKIVAKKGSFKEMDGYYVDADGKKIGLLSKIGGAIAGAASKTADGFKKVFSGLFSSKEKVGSTYLLSNITFDTESHKITDFSKNEVEGLAAALKAMPDAKIKVQVHSTDGKDEKQSKEFTKLRANVVHDMLVTLGVSDKQISFKGMGNGDAAKASGHKVEIMVEETVK